MTREPTEMEIRVAKALCIADGIDPETIGYGMGNIMPTDWRGPVWQARMTQARAAIQALREPTKDMLLAGEYAFEDFKDSDTDSYGTHNFIRSGHEAATFRAMIDAASPPQ